jgi:ssRNA-specific RNase YbeY (16S rRNA maturation enzyme)
MTDCATPYEVELEEELGWNTIHGFLHDNMVINLTQVVSN